jgi:hypothetical protein
MSQTASQLAKEIRQEGEKWPDAVKRAAAILKNEKQPAPAPPAAKVSEESETAYPEIQKSAGKFYVGGTECKTHTSAKKELKRQIKTHKK